MKHRREQKSGRIILSLERGDNLCACVEGLALKEGIEGAEVRALGAIEDPELGFYDLATQTYARQTVSGIFELVSLLGNITRRDGKPFLHAHVSCGRRDLSLFGGHLFKAKVGVVVEMVIDPFEESLDRILCPEIGLPRWEPHHTRTA